MAGHNVVRLATDRLGSVSVDYDIKFANIAVASTGDNTLVAGVAGKKIRVVSLFLIADGTVTAYFVDGGNTALAGDGTTGISLVGNMGFVLDFNPGGWFETTAADSLDINLSGAIGVAGSLSYIEV